MVKEGFYLLVFVGIIALLAGVFSFVAPALEKASQAVVNVQSAPQLAQITVTAAQYAHSVQSTRDALDAYARRAEIERQSTLTAASARATIIYAQNDADARRAEIERQNTLTAASAQANVIRAQNDWILPAALAFVVCFTLTSMTVGYVARQRTVTAAIQARSQQASNALAVVRENGGAVKLYNDRVEVEVKPNYAPPDPRRALNAPQEIPPEYPRMCDLDPNTRADIMRAHLEQMRVNHQE